VPCSNLFNRLISVVFFSFDHVTFGVMCFHFPFGVHEKPSGRGLIIRWKRGLDSSKQLLGQLVTVITSISFPSNLIF